MPNTWSTLPLSIFTMTMWAVAHYPHFEDGKLKVQQGWVTCSKSHSWSMNELGLCQPRVLISSIPLSLPHWLPNNGMAVSKKLTAHPGRVGQILMDLGTVSFLWLTLRNWSCRHRRCSQVRRVPSWFHHSLAVWSQTSYCWLPTPQRDSQSTLLIKQSQVCCSLHWGKPQASRVVSEGKGKSGIFIRFGWAGSEHRYFNAGPSMAWSKIHNTNRIGGYSKEGAVKQVLGV